MTKSQAGSLGGKATAERHGSEYMAQIGKRGGISLHTKYRLQHYGQDDFLLVNRATGEALPKTLNGRNWRE